jgi:RNA recognition motif-containing protein
MERSNLIVNYLQTNVNEDDLNRLFSEYGLIQSLKIVRDKATGISMGFGFVNFETNEAASRAAEALNGLELHGKRIKVSVARPAWKANIHSNLYIANLPTGFTENDVMALVGPELAVHIEHVRMLKNSENASPSSSTTPATTGSEFRAVAVARFDTEESAMIALEFLNTISVESLSTLNLRCQVHAKPWRPEFRPERASSALGVLPPAKVFQPNGPSRRYSLEDSISSSSTSGPVLDSGPPMLYAPPMGVVPVPPPPPSAYATMAAGAKPFVPTGTRWGGGLPMIPPTPPPHAYGYPPYPSPVLGPAMISSTPPPIVPPHMMGGGGVYADGVVISESEEGILTKSFEQFGSLSGIHLAADRSWGYVRFPDQHSAISAINNLTGFNVNGKILELEAAI